jgi:undecaprenyl-diphosphatase
MVAEALALVAGMGLTVLAVHLAKDAVNRPRPPDPLVGAADASYPSGHSAYAIAYVAIAVALSRTMPGLAGKVGVPVAAVALAVLVGLTRMYLRVHYFSDVIGGYGLACALFSLCAIVALIVTHLRQNATAV